MELDSNNFTGVIPCLMSSFEYDTDSMLVSCLPVDIVHLFSSVSNEFSDDGVKFFFNTTDSHLMIDIGGVGVTFLVVSIENEKWTRADPSTSFIIKSRVKLNKVIAKSMIIVDSSLPCDCIPYYLANELNRTFEGCRFYVSGDYLAIECDLYITHGVMALNVMDVIVYYINVVKTLNSEQSKSIKK
ncbi:hypothetical protein GLP21_12125 [Photobacterium carnosum]|uniref:Uncharacterized protein n=2 Tax=Photobacterium TaxID=657 RepID=A0A2N4UW12_9GAMM|nr:MULTISPECIES: hypothetical protein [Photobacterium]MCD9485863.1 hypothetical protein [Photobacterium iliopiscarium]MCD9507674.1 hypothetical protein [Photobacterium phosphoreum]MCD9538205.1 hypothetical protein [Photobacterium carnosum]MCD9543009.1 hypothetical protein [Photobacterium carnosum]MCD9545894.1 hypothetical protein [Photobacterium carnosum]